MPDSGTCLVVLASMLVMTFVYGMLFVFGSFFTAMIEEYNEKRAKTATVQSLFIGVGLTSGVISGMLISRFGIRKVSMTGAVLVPTGFILTYLSRSITASDVTIGVIAGFGVSLMQVSSLTVASRSFTGRRRALIIAMLNACMSAGGIVLPFINDALLKKYGLRETFVILGAMYLNCIPAALILSTKTNTKVKELNGDQNATAESLENQGFSLFQMIKKFYSDFKEIMTLQYCFVILAGGITISALDGYMSLILDIFKWKGFSTDDAVIALTVANVAGLTARMVAGLVKQVKDISCYAAPISCTIFGVAGQLIMYFAKSLDVSYVGCSIVGLAAGGLSASGYIIVAKYSDDDKLSISLGLALTSIGLFVAVTGPSFGAIYDTYRSYEKVHFIIIAIQVLGAALYVMSLCRSSRSRKQKTIDCSISVYVVNQT